MTTHTIEARGIRGAAEVLCLAAAPTFAAMALLTALSGDGTQDILCAAHGASPLNGMAAMYLLMSAVHLAPWLKLLAGRQPNVPFSLTLSNKE